MKEKLPTIARYLLGVIFFVFGLNGFLNFIPTPPPESFPEGSRAFIGAMIATKYFFPLLKTTETACGALLLGGFAVPAVLVILAPITIQIFFFHSFMTPGLGNLVLPVIIIAAHVTAATKYWNLYKPLFVTRG
jgi:uncharacterized membrane protein YphA (DoxX/SURF4 family)